MLGIPLATATRNDARALLKQQGVVATREDSRYWVDLYDPHSALHGAAELKVGYVMRSGRLAYLEYKFPAFMEAGKIKQVADMVALKYGRPTTSRGSVNLGEVEYGWNLSGGVKLVVWRGWPDTSVTMTYKVADAFKLMQAEFDENEKAQKQEATKKQSNAF